MRTQTNGLKRLTTYHSRLWLCSLLGLCLWLALCGSAQAQSVIDAYNPNANDRVISMAVQPDGKVVVGGAFNAINGTTRSHIARLHADGTPDAGFDPGVGANDWVYSLAVQPDGKLLMGGDFTAFNGSPRSRIARLNADGSVDAAFHPVVDGRVYHLTVQPDGKVLIAGLFTNVNGSPRNRIARLNADGSLDASFDPGTGANGGVLSLALQPDGKVVVAGLFTLFNGSAHTRVVRLNANGATDAGFHAGTGADREVYSLALQPDGKVLMAGFFTDVNSTPRNRVARLNANGALDASFNPGNGADGGVYRLAVQPDGKVLIGGEFTSVNGTARNRIARLNLDGTLDTSFNPGTGANDMVFGLAVQPDGKVLAGGLFTTFNGSARNHMARLNADGALETSLNAAVSSFVYSLALQSDDKILLGGGFTTINGTTRDHIARLHADGTLDAGFAPGTNPGSFVTGLAVQSDGKVVVGGDFNKVNGTTRNRIARLHADGTLDTSFNPAANSTVQSLTVQSDGKTLVAGSFTTINTISHQHIARLNADGTLDSSFNPGTVGDVLSVAVQPDGKILLGGGFTQVNGTVRNDIARLNADGSLDTGFDPGLGADGSVYSVVVQPDGKVLVGGNFTKINGTARNNIARLNADGSLDGSFNPGTGADSWVFSLALQPDGKVLMGGLFTLVNGNSRNRIARLNADGSLDASFSPGSGADLGVYSMAVQRDGKVLLAGGFSTVAGLPRSRIARLSTAQAALQSLEVTAVRDGVRWWRSGSGAALSQVRFAVATSPDAPPGNWTQLGAGQPVAGGWALDGLSTLQLPRNTLLWLRAEGAVSAGAYNGSGSLLRSEQMLYLAAAPVVMPATALPTTAQGGAFSGVVPTPAGAAPPVNFALAAGSTLPAGLSLNPVTGAISGAPTTAGSYAFTVAVSDGAAIIHHYPFTLTVGPAVVASVPGAVTAVPVNAPWALVLVSALLGLLGWRQRRVVR